jgi:hypothetical protein
MSMKNSHAELWVTDLSGVARNIMETRAKKTLCSYKWLPLIKAGLLSFQDKTAWGTFRWQGRRLSLLSISSPRPFCPLPSPLPMAISPTSPYTLDSSHSTILGCFVYGELNMQILCTLKVGLLYFSTSKKGYAYFLFLQARFSNITISGGQRSV